MKVIRRILLIVLIISLSSCASTRRMGSHKQMSTQRGEVTIRLDHYEYQTKCMLKVCKNEWITLSVLPLLGIEMFRIEATPNYVVVFDKMNRRYAEMTYSELNAWLPRRISFKILQILTKKTDKDIALTFEVGKHTLDLHGTFGAPEYSSSQEYQSLYKNKVKYKQVDLREILPL